MLTKVYSGVYLEISASPISFRLLASIALVIPAIFIVPSVVLFLIAFGAKAVLAVFNAWLDSLRKSNAGLLYALVLEYACDDD